MNNIDHAVEWVNGTGRREYQPATAEGEREWLEEVFDMPGFPTYLVPVWKHPKYVNGLNPRLYRSRLHAAYVARCYERRKAAYTWEEA